MVDLMCCLVNLVFFEILLLYYYINLNSSIICCLPSGDIRHFLGNSISFLALSKLFFDCDSFGDFFRWIVLLS